MIQIYADDVLVYDSRLEEYELAKLKVTTGLNTGGTAEIVMPVGHPAYYSYTYHKTIVTIYRDGVLRFRGRALYPTDNFYGQRTITCEGEMCLLRDGVSRPYLYQTTPAAIFTEVVNDYNSQVESFKQFRVGAITVTDTNDYIRLESENAEQILDTINKLLERCGGYIVFTTDANGARVINWLASVDRPSGQEIELGENLLDFSSTGADSVDLITGLVPYGAKDESTGKRLTIESVNNGRDYITAEDAKRLRGTIMATATWDDVTEPGNLLRKAQAYLTENKVIITSLELSALDLSYLDKDLDAFTVGDLIRVVSVPHGVDEDFLLTQMTEDLLDPSQSRIVLGKSIQSLTGASVGSANRAMSQLEAAKVEIKADYALNTAQVAAELEKTLVSKIEQLSDSIVLELSETYVTRSEHVELSSRVEMLAGSISLQVTGALGGKASIILAADGKTYTDTLDLSKVRQSFAADASEVVISGGKITFNSNTLVVNSTNLQVDATGTITATNAELSGNLTTESGQLMSKLDSGTLRFYYASTEMGSFASTRYADDASKRGLAVHLKQAATFIAFGRDTDSDGTYTWDYVINHELNPDGLTEKHLFYGTARFTSAVYCSSPVYFNNSVVFDNEYGVRLYTADKSAHVIVLNMFNTDIVRFGNSNYQTRIYGTSINFYNPTYMRQEVYCTYNLYIANQYCLRTYTTDGVGAQAVFMNDSNALYFGSNSYPTYVAGSTVTVGNTSYNTNLYGAWVYLRSKMYCYNVPIIFSNGYGIQCRNSSGGDHYVLSMTSSNAVMVGASGHQLRLRGSTVVLDGSGTTVTSDRRKKNSIEELPDAYEAMLDKLIPVRFKYNDGTSGRYHAGFEAQAVLEALEAVGLTSQDFGGFVDLHGDGEELGLIYTEFIALLLLKIKRQERRIAALEAAQ